MKNKLMIVLLIIIATASGVMAALPSDNPGDIIKVDVKFLGTLNLINQNSHDEWINFILYSDKDINLLTVTVNDVPAVVNPSADQSDIPDDEDNTPLWGETQHLKVSSKVVDWLGSNICVDQVELIVGGYFVDGTRFEVKSFIKVKCL